MSNDMTPAFASAIASSRNSVRFAEGECGINQCPHACSCTVKTATKPPQPIEKSTAGASLLAEVIVAKTVDHLPLYRQEKIFERHGVEISRKTMGGWMGQCADLLKPLYGSIKEVLFQSKVIGTDDTGVKVLDEKLSFARTGRIWPYHGDQEHPAIVYDFTPTRERAGPEKFLEGYRGYLQADAYAGYDAFFKDPARGLMEVGCWGHYPDSGVIQRSRANVVY
jgi:transposase